MPFWHGSDLQISSVPGGGSVTTARKELDHKVADQRPAPGTIVPGETQVHLTYWLYAESALEVKASFMADAKTYLLMVRGGALPYDVVASYDVPKNMAGQKIVRITPLTDSPGSPGLEALQNHQSHSRRSSDGRNGRQGAQAQLQVAPDAGQQVAPVLPAAGRIESVKKEAGRNHASFCLQACLAE